MPDEKLDEENPDLVGITRPIRTGLSAEFLESIGFQKYDWEAAAQRRRENPVENVTQPLSKPDGLIFDLRMNLSEIPTAAPAPMTRREMRRIRGKLGKTTREMLAEYWGTNV